MVKSATRTSSALAIGAPSGGLVRVDVRQAVDRCAANSLVFACMIFVWRRGREFGYDYDYIDTSLYPQPFIFCARVILMPGCCGFVLVGAPSSVMRFLVLVVFNFTSAFGFLGKILLCISSGQISWTSSGTALDESLLPLMPLVSSRYVGLGTLACLSPLFYNYSHSGGHLGE
ncbi:hypothetical protein F2Q68_00015137 [Brassica cretica]|uniref:Transmembrane protein n=1 Tax=Brassica cretica TaxID=69181 RepID=A0A8S9HS12_BRACR|nr:hypothetical protein F2Q68_00015137 [Brassica cretica]